MAVLPVQIVVRIDLFRLNFKQIRADSRRQFLRALSDKLNGIDKDTRERIFRALRTAFRAEEDEENLSDAP